MATRYRDLQPRSLIDVGARSTPTGAANAAQALAESFSSFSRASADVGSLAQKFAAGKAEEAGAQAGLAGKPEMRKGLQSLTAVGRAYNSAALRGYAIRSDLDANNTAARLEVEAGTDPDRFRKTAEAARDAVLAEAPEEARAALQEIWAKRIGEGTARINGALATELRNEDRTLISENIAQKTERIAYLRSLSTPEAFAEADEEEVKLTLMLDGAVGDGTLSETEGTALRRGVKRDVLMATVLERFKNELNDLNGDPVGMLEMVKDVVREDQSLTPEEEAKLEESLFAALRDRNSLDAMRASADAAEREARYAAGDRAATTDLLGGKLTQRRLLQMIQADQLSPQTARTLLNELQSGSSATPKSDPAELFHVETNLLSTTEEEIVENQGLTWADRQRLVLKRRDEVAGWKGTQVAREAFDRIDRALGIVPGISSKLLTDEEARSRDEALSELYDIVDALPPEERQAAVLSSAQQVVAARIRKSASDEAAVIRQRLAAYQSDKDPAGMSENKRKEYDAQVARYENRIRELESKAQGAQ